MNRLNTFGGATPGGATPGRTQSDLADRLWAVVLAGGEGVRLRPLVRHLYGDERPKQYAALLGSRSLLRQTLDRVALLVPPHRTVVVTSRAHEAYLAAELPVPPATPVLAQPADRGTAAGILFPTHWIQWKDPDALVAILPSDHFVREEWAFMGHVADVAKLVRRDPRWIVLLGARATEPETEYGWIEPGESLGSLGLGGLRRVHRFWEKPPIEVARSCLAQGCLWNTLVLVATASTLVEAGRQALPELHERLVRIRPFANTGHEARAIEDAYAQAPNANFSYSVLEQCSEALAVSSLPPLTWCDLGTPDRVLRTLRDLKRTPAWALTLTG